MRLSIRHYIAFSIINLSLGFSLIASAEEYTPVWESSWTYAEGTVYIKLPQLEISSPEANPEPLSHHQKMVFIHGESDPVEVCKLFAGPDFTEGVSSKKESAGLQKMVQITATGEKTKPVNLANAYLSSIHCRNPNRPFQPLMSFHKMKRHKEGIVEMRDPYLSIKSQTGEEGKVIISSLSNLDGVCRLFGQGPHVARYPMKDKPNWSWANYSGVVIGNHSLVSQTITIPYKRDYEYFSGLVTLPNFSSSPPAEKFITRIFCSAPVQAAEPQL